jgi:hypothetical protein
MASAVKSPEQLRQWRVTHARRQAAIAAQRRKDEWERYRQAHRDQMLARYDAGMAVEHANRFHHPAKPFPMHPFWF